MTRRAVALGGVGLMVPVLSLRAQPRLPGGPVRMYVGFSPGGSADVVARLVAAKLQERTGLNVIVENKPGAGGVIATEAVSKAAPDGNSIVLAAMASTIMAKLTYTKLPYDPQRDLSPVGLVSTFQLALTVTPASPVQTVDQFIAWAKANPALANFGVPAVGGHSHFFGVMLGRTIGIDMQPIPYKGSTPMITDLSSGQIQVGVSALSDFMGAYRGGKVRIIATTGSERSPSAPELPTFSEAGHKALTGVGWLGYYAPANTPREIAAALSAEIAAILALPDVRERIVTMGMEPRPSTPEGLAAFDEAERQRWEPVVKATGFKVE